MSETQVKRSAVHSTFAIERTYDAAPSRVFNAFADKNAKAKWFGGPDEWDKGQSAFDFRVGGREISSGGPKGGVVHKFEALYYDIVPNERIVYSYDLFLDDKKISVSLTTIELVPNGKGTKLKFTEQGVYLDGYDDAGKREEGSKWLLGKLGDSLAS